MSATVEAEDRDILEPFKEQTPFVYDREKRYYGFISGSGAGKTAAGLARTELNAEEWNRGAMGAIIAPTGKMIKNNIIPLMRKFGYLQDWTYKGPHSDEPGIHTPDGGRILLLSASDERTIEYLNGLNLAYIWMDEHRDIPPRATEIAIQRLRVGDYRNLYVTTTPRGKNHSYDFFVGEHTVDQYRWGESTIYEAEDRIAITGVPTYANPFNPEDYNRSVGKDLPEEIRAQEVEGQFVEIGSGVYTRESFQFVTPDEIKDSYEINYVLGVDPAVKADRQSAQASDSDYWAVTLCAIHRVQNQIYAVDQRRNRGMSLKEGTEWVAEIASNVPNPNLYVESNQSQRWLAQELADYGLNVTQVQTGRNKEEKLLSMSIPIENNLVKFVNHEIDKQVGYDPRWQDLIDEALAFPEGSHDDLLDSLNIVIENANISRTMSLSADMYGRDDE
jgi:predicted phage terminase large subunit-like protein